MDRKPYVMQILPALQSGGVERGTIEIAKALKEAEYPNCVVSSGGPMAYELKRIGVEHITLPVHSKNPFKIWRNSRRLKKIIAEKGIDIVHARSRAPAWVAWLAIRKNPSVRFLTTFHGTYGISPRFLKKPYNAVMTKGKLIVSISNFITKHLKDNYNVSEDKLRLIHRGADVEKFDTVCVSPERVVSLVEKWQVPLDRPVIMLPGRLTRWKGQLVLLEALSLMKHQKLVCILVGSDQGRTSYTQELKEKIQKLKKEVSVLIVDHCSDMPAAYMLSDIVVSASTDPEAFGRVIPEAQAMGRLVVGSNHGGATETIDDGKTGFLVPPSDAQALAKTLDRMLEMPLDARKQMSSDAMDSVRMCFSVHKMCSKTLAVYDELMEE
ncbi:MAG: glycosyltransferase family 4 protein [Alphaproteobacteria bacterium]|nr:glycosyltransferase family 4 protein [Alphaproteobacteria bacterium]